MPAESVEKDVKHPFRAALIAFVSTFGLASVLVHPFGTVKAPASSAPLLAGAEIGPSVAHGFERSCQDCHSERTEWPWYSYVAPMSWLVERDVRDARSRMNLSRWGEYSIAKRQELLSELGVMVRNQLMPPARYLLLHPGENLSNSERDVIYEWERGERRRLKTATRAKSGASGD
jgi:hypothetical protein